METTSLTPSQALSRLMEGNRKFFSGEYDVRPVPEALPALEAGQRPFAAVVCCSDARVPPELVFSCALGELFVVRTAGGVVTDCELGSVEYAVKTLGVPLVLVLGHRRCGAVACACRGDSPEGGLRAVMDYIAPAVALARATAESEDEVTPMAEEYNVLSGLSVLRESPVLRALPSAACVGAMYDLHTGRVSLLTPSP